jgi:hypothetical protein
VSEHLPGTLAGHAVVGLVWFIFLGSLLVALEDRGAFWAGVASWAALALPVAVLGGSGRRVWVYALETAWLAAWAVVAALALT